MTEIPREALSDHFQLRMEGRRLRSAVLMTYQFDPGFFEQEVLPAFVDIGLSHASAIRLLQLDDAIRDLAGEISVYYDAGGLVVGDAGSAKLDVRYVPIQHNAIFHPKNVLLLVEDEEADEDGFHPLTLLVACMSANLTRSGWWENIECCHVEEITEGDKTRLKDDLTKFLQSIKRRSPDGTNHVAIDDILTFLRTSEQRKQRSIAGELQSHFYCGGESLPEFLERQIGNQMQGGYLEIISPYFDDAEQCEPLIELIRLFEPKEVRVFLPRNAAGEALVRKELFESVAELPKVHWGHLSKDIMRRGSREEAGERFVHAKIYRFFTQNPKREICFLGSPNLTRSAHQKDGNVESGFLVEVPTPRRPEFWLSPESKTPVEFKVSGEDEGAGAGRSPLNLRYNWDSETATAFWDEKKASPELRITDRNVALCDISALNPRKWTALPIEVAKAIAGALSNTSLLEVHVDGEEPAFILVQEEGMSHKPSLLLQLSTADILRYWSLLSAEQRAAFIDSRATDLAGTGTGTDLVVRAKIALDNDSLFDRFAGFFHAFGCLERAVRKSLDERQAKQASYRLFGRKYDSLGTLLDRVSAQIETLDAVDGYVILMCCKQLCSEIEKDYPEYWREQGENVKKLDARLADLASIRDRLLKENGDEFGEFLTWFDKWFLKRAKPVEATDA
ncbi:hypothetical protein [Rosistilla oblonga]|uniref:hypothetical protein n=1 Tax=Rosistilla oblonga TaxID=2527990 RepID=UPI003A982230